MKKNGKKEIKQAKETKPLIAEKEPETKDEQPKDTGPSSFDRWLDSHPTPVNSPIEKILEFPGIEDMAGVLARAKFQNERQRIAAVRLAYKNRKFHDEAHQHMLRDLCASTLSTGGLGKVIQTFVGTNLLAPDMFRAALGMPKNNKPEEVHRGSDFRSEGREKEREQREQNV